MATPSRRQLARYRALKRAVDFVGASLGLLVLSPILAFVAGAIALEMGVPILYRGRRIGRQEKPFRILKFRTMIQRADQLGSSVTKWEDRRITPLGRFLRGSKLDELPQLWNVIRGEMSFVGPRPDTPDVVATYSPDLRRVLELTPGITSIASLELIDEVELLAGVKDPDRAYVETIVPAKVRLALEHLERHSLMFDFGVLWRTVLALFVDRGRRESSRLTSELRSEILSRDSERNEP